MGRRSGARTRTRVHRSNSGGDTPPSSPSWIPTFNSTTTNRGGHLPPAPSVMPAKAISKRKRGPYLCTRCGEPKKGHTCTVALMSPSSGQAPSIFEPRLFVHSTPGLAPGQPVISTPPPNVVIPAASGAASGVLDVQALFDNAVSSFYSATSRQPSMTSSGVPHAKGAPWFDMPLSSLRSLSQVLRSDTSGWESAQETASEVEEMIMILEDKKRSFVEHSHSADRRAAVALQSALGERTITQIFRDVSAGGDPMVSKGSSLRSST